jgi:hypothetical protein
MSLFSTASFCAHKTKMNSRNGRRRRSSTRTMRFLLNMASTQIMTERACASSSNWSDPMLIRESLCTKSSSNCSYARALLWITVMRRSLLRPSRAQRSMKHKELEKTKEQCSGQHHQSDPREETRSHQCMMSRPRSSGSQDKDLHPAHLPHTCTWRSPPSTAGLFQRALHQGRHTRGHIQVNITLRRITSPWKEAG